MANNWAGKVTGLRRLLGRSDIGRWRVDESFHDNWNERTLQMATLINPNEVVLEFGAGMLTLREYLPDGAEHIATDLVSRGPGTLVCDLNSRTLPALPHADVAFFSGVLEYVNNLPRALGQVSELASAIVCSYATLDTNPEGRRGHGWVNDYSERELVALFEDLGYSCGSREVWKQQMLFRFNRP